MWTAYTARQVDLIQEHNTQEVILITTKDATTDIHLMVFKTDLKLKTRSQKAKLPTSYIKQPWHFPTDIQKIRHFTSCHCSLWSFCFWKCYVPYVTCHLNSTSLPLPFRKKKTSFFCIWSNHGIPCHHVRPHKHLRIPVVCEKDGGIFEGRNAAKNSWDMYNNDTVLIIIMRSNDINIP